MYELVVDSEAVVDMQIAFEWYQHQKPGLGNELVYEIEISLEKICERPFAFAAINERYRRVKVNRFPYIIIYEVEGKKVYINTVRHTSRKAKY